LINVNGATSDINRYDVVADGKHYNMHVYTRICPMSLRSSQVFIVHLQSGTIQKVTAMPLVIFHSTGEAKYCTAGLAIIGENHSRRSRTSLFGGQN
jgi:hypothetical protein